MARALMAGPGQAGPWTSSGVVNSGIAASPPMLQGGGMVNGGVANASMVNAGMANGAMVSGPNGGNAAMVNAGVVNAGMVNAGMVPGGPPVMNAGAVNGGVVNSGVVNGGGMGIVNSGVANGGLVTNGSAMSSGAMMTGGTTMVGGSPVTAVAVPNDPCGCGPAASAGDCSGTMGGAETMCCEPTGGTQSVQWVPATGGGYAAVTSYQFVGEGAGGYERQVVTQWYGWRLRKCCLGLLGLLLLSALLYGLLSLFDQDDEPTQPNTTPLPEVVISTPAPEIVQPRAPETCLIFGDPHVKTFDGKRADYYTSGEYWIVRSNTVHIQARYLPTKMTNHLAVTKAIAIGGPFIGNHKLIIDVEKITWDGDTVMEGFDKLGTTWHNADPAINIVYNSEGTIMQKSREGKSLHVVHIQLPMGVSLEINRWNEPSEGHYVNTRLIMPNQPGQDGHCGNFNGNADDDTRVSVRSRVGTKGVPQDELIFPGPKTPVNPGNRPDLNDCPEGQLKVAMEKCKAAEHKFFPSRACLIDTCLGHMTPQAV